MIHVYPHVPCSWLRPLNEYGVCLLTNVPTTGDKVREVQTTLYMNCVAMFIYYVSIPIFSLLIVLV